MTKAFTISIDEATLTALDDLAAKADCSRDALVNEALGNFLELRAWQLKKIEAGLEAAERGDFVSDAEIEQIVGKHGPAE